MMPWTDGKSLCHISFGLCGVPDPSQCENKAMRQGDLNPPSAIGTYGLAEDFHKAACHLSQSINERKLSIAFSTNLLIHLHSHSIELALKGFLLAKGCDEAGLRKIGHNLIKAFSKSIENGLAFDSAECGERVRSQLEWLNSVRIANDMKYFRRINIENYRIDEIQYANNCLIEMVRIECESASVPRQVI